MTTEAGNLVVVGLSLVANLRSYQSESRGFDPRQVHK